MYWRERDGAVKFANKFTGNQFMTVPVVSEGGEKLAEGTGLRIYHPVIQPESTPRSVFIITDLESFLIRVILCLVYCGMFIEDST